MLKIMHNAYLVNERFILKKTFYLQEHRTLTSELNQVYMLKPLCRAHKRVGTIHDVIDLVGFTFGHVQILNLATLFSLNQYTK